MRIQQFQLGQQRRLQSSSIFIGRLTRCLVDVTTINCRNEITSFFISQNRHDKIIMGWTSVTNNELLIFIARIY